MSERYEQRTTEIKRDKPVSRFKKIVRWITRESPKDSKTQRVGA